MIIDRAHSPGSCLQAVGSLELKKRAIKISVVYFDGNEDMISARVAGFIAPKSKAVPG